MLPLDDPRWAEMKGGYRRIYDARPLIERFSTDRDSRDCWAEVWNELHHQGDVDTASYAVLPYLVSTSRQRQRDWNLYSFAATLCIGSDEGQNPSVPDYLEPGFSDSLNGLFELAIGDLRAGASPRTIRCILSFIAALRRTPALARAIINIDLFEHYGERVLETERNGSN